MTSQHEVLILLPCFTQKYGPLQALKMRLSVPGRPLQVAVPSTAHWIGAQLLVEIAVLVTCHRSGVTACDRPVGTRYGGANKKFELGNHRIRVFEEGIIRNSSNGISEHHFGRG